MCSERLKRILCSAHCCLRDRTDLVIGDDNLVMLTITAVNHGEGAYETELHTLIPPEADYIGVERRVEVNTYTHTQICLKTLLGFDVEGPGGCTH